MTKKLLLADDSVVIQKLVGLSFANENVEIIYTDNGDDAVTRAREVVPDVVLADVVMPGMSGYEVCEKLKQDSALAHIPVLLLTGTFEAFDEARAESVGADGQITKPFEAQALVSRVTDVMNSPVAAQPTASAVTGSDPMASILSATSAVPSISETPAVQTQASVAEAEAIDFPFDQAGASQSALVSDLLTSPEEASAMPLDSVPEATFEPDPDPPALPPDYLSPPPLSPSPPETENATDAMAALQQELTPAGESDISAFDVDAALSVGTPDSEATLFVAEENLSAQTTRNWSEPIGTSSGLDDEPASTDASEAVLSPQQDSAPPEPEVLYGRRANDLGLGLGETVVTDLDEQLASGRSASSSSAAAPLLSPFGDEAVEPLDTTDSEMIDIGPISQESEDLNFGFDVSEQQETTDPGNQLSQSFSSQADLSDSETMGSPVKPAPLMSDFDVSSSDLTDLPPAHTPQQPTPESLSETPSAQGRFGPAIAIGSDDVSGIPSPENEYAADESDDAEAFSNLGVAGAGAGIAAAAAATRSAFDQPEPSAAATERVPDLSPMMEQRIQEALEKVAWEAFSDLSESIVKQVMSRVENIAWEVIPQMAETLVREEIRQMKGEEED